MKKILLIALLLMFVFFNTGCNLKTIGNFEDTHEIENLEFVRGIGIDLINDKFRISVVVEKTTATSSSQEKTVSNQKSHGEVFYVDSDSISEAIMNIDSISDNHIFLGQLDFFVIGEDAAKTDIIKAIDFTSRYNEIRVISQAYISKGMSAFDFLKKSSKLELFIGNKLANLTKHETSQIYVVPTDILKIMGFIDNDLIGYVVPSVSLVSDNSLQEGKEQLNVQLDGYAVFKNNKLLTYIDDKELLYGINIINGDVSTGIVNVKILDNVPISLKVLRIESKINTSFTEQDPTINIEAHIESNIIELSKSVNIFHSKYFDMLDDQQELYIKKCIEKAINFSQQNNVDILGFSDTLHRQHPYKWESIKNNWSKIFPQIPIAINVKSQIRRTLDIRQTQGTKVE